MSVFKKGHFHMETHLIHLGFIASGSPLIQLDCRF